MVVGSCLKSGEIRKTKPSKINPQNICSVDRVLIFGTDSVKATSKNANNRQQQQGIKAIKITQNYHGISILSITMKTSQLSLRPALRRILRGRKGGYKLTMTAGILINRLHRQSQVWWLQMRSLISLCITTHHMQKDHRFRPRHLDRPRDDGRPTEVLYDNTDVGCVIHVRPPKRFSTNI